jgi:hypothetical protein
LRQKQLTTVLFIKEDRMIGILPLIAALCMPALAREQYPGQYENIPPEVRQWFRAQKSPRTGALCCNEADGVYAEEDIRNGHYWTRWPGQDWRPVPDEVVIQAGNPHGAPVVWWYVERGETKIRCYAPGGGV